MPVKKTTRQLKQQKPEKPESKTGVVKLPKTDEINIIHVNYQGQVKAPIKLPKSVFGDRRKTGMFIQSLRVYGANLHQGTQSVKTRGEVAGSTRKIYRQKGTGRARHGSLKAPIFVGGGVAFGPQSHKRTLDLPRKMRQQTVRQALLNKIEAKLVTVISGIEKLSGKTKEIVHILAKMQLLEKRVLFLVNKEDVKTARAARNIASLSVRFIDGISLYDVVKHEQIVLTEKALEKFTKGKSSTTHLSERST